MLRCMVLGIEFPHVLMGHAHIVLKKLKSRLPQSLGMSAEDVNEGYNGLPLAKPIKAGSYTTLLHAHLASC